MSKISAEEHILVVDDDSGMRYITSEILLMQPYLVTVADSGEAALKLIKTVHFDLVLTDMNMPGISGIALLELIKQDNPDIPIVIMTGDPSVAAAVDSLKLGADDYITKPIDGEKLLLIIKKVLHSKRETREENLIGQLKSGTYRGKIGGYKIISKLGQGNRGIVLLAGKQDGEQTSRYALKVLDMSDIDEFEKEDILQRFLLEAESAAMVTHPNVVKIIGYDITNGDGIPYLVMECINGSDLCGFIPENRKLNLQQKLLIIRQIASALAAIHAKGLCHRDIKPANIMIDDTLKVTLMDFGIVRMPNSNLTITTDFMGTPNYLSPEGFISAKVDHRSDIFSLGVLAYELFLDERPFVADSLPVLQNLIQACEPRTPREIVPDFPEYLQNILHMMLRKQPGDRYQFAGDIVADIDKFIDESGTIS